jgi:5-methyltetrahydrofolate--homocysteine methyltransferase
MQQPCSSGGETGRSASGSAPTRAAQGASPLAAAIVGFREAEVKRLVSEMVAQGVPPEEVLAECNRGMIELGKRFSDGSCFLPELMYGGMIMKSVTAQLGPQLSARPGQQSSGTIVMGAVQHDVHDIGKDIVVMMLRGAGFEVIDLGVDVPPAKFVEAVRGRQPLALGMSVLLTTCFRSVADTVAAVRAAGLRDRVKLMVGGAAASDLLAESTGCDFYGKTAVDAVHFASALVAVK